MSKSAVMKKTETQRSYHLLYWLTLSSSLIYIGWRFLFTLPYAYGMLSFVCGLLLVVSEAMGIFEALQQFHGMRNKYEPKKPQITNIELYPDVDVFIATYNESTNLLYKTINGCKNMVYPDQKKVHIYLCDDGNREEMKTLAKEMRIGYIARNEHKDAKAGNLNHALGQTTSPLIATFDADMIPLHDFLMEMIPYFFLPYYEEIEGEWKQKKISDKEHIGFIQAPQSFYNADLFQYYLYAESKVPNEQDYFYRDVQLARNQTNSAIYGGSNTVISREALLEVGGFFTGVITEDFATGISIQAKGYRCYAISKILAIGLAPTDLKSLIKQRERWARGCIQTLKRVHFLFRKGLSIGQKISYLSSLLYWYTCFRRLMYILSPILFAVFQVRVVECTLSELCVFWLPYYIIHRIALKVFSNGIRNDRWSNVYDTILFPSLLIPVFLETLGISQRTFAVTNKKRVADERSYQWRKAFPHIILAGFSSIGILQSLYACFTTNSIYYTIVIFWLIVNLYALIMSIFFMLGRKAFRQSERFYIKAEARLRFHHIIMMGKTLDLSEGGFSLSFDEPVYVPHHETCYVELWDDYHGCHLEAHLVQVVQMENQWKYGFQITTLPKGQRSRYYQLIYDRVHTLPLYLEKYSSFFDDLSQNILLRMVPLKSSTRDFLPHIPLHKKLLSDTSGMVLMKLFSYETCELYSLEQPLSENMELKVIFDINIQLHRYANHGQSGLFMVKNVDDLKQNEVFVKILQAWIWEQQEYEKKKMRQRKASQHMVPEDEFDETTLYGEGFR